jgi:hypothetical protein
VFGEHQACHCRRLITADVGAGGIHGAAHLLGDAGQHGLRVEGGGDDGARLAQHSLRMQLPLDLDIEAGVLQGNGDLSGKYCEHR